MAKKNSEGKVIEFKNKKRAGKSGLILVIVIVIAIAYFAMSAIKIVKLNAEKEEALARQEELLMIKEDLTAEYANISSAQYIERLARRDLKLVKSLFRGEVMAVRSKRAFLKELPSATHVLCWEFRREWFGSPFSFS